MANRNFSIDIGSFLEVINAVAKIGSVRVSLQEFDDMTFPIEYAMGIIQEMSGDVIKQNILLQLQRALILQYQNQSDFDSALNLSEQIYKDIEMLADPTIMISALAQRGNLLRRAGRYDAAKSVLEDALNTAEENGLIILNSSIEYELGYIAYCKGRFDEACRYFKDSVNSAVANDDLLGQLAGHGVLSKQYSLNGLIDQAFDEVELAFKKLSANANDFEADWIKRWEANLTIHRGEIELQRNELDAARTLFLEGKRMFGEINLGQTVAPTIAYKFGALYLEEGDFNKSIAHLSEAQRVYEMRGQKSIEESISEVIALLGRAHFRAGNLDQAKLNLTDAIKYPKDNANRRGHAWAHLDLALIEVTEGRLDKAKEYLNKALSVVQHHYRIERELIEKRIAEL